ncbi:kinase-like domain-containing protein [Suillus clintonianus]|uniref:kinase-like domain-containing protein n=1 Tax=Suillus clintonianus TaxID=1904413 RepID=UPI001B87B8CF|nr:kinase-like domain-containing protein [Suillus clintonianus]KAG2132066.1 kinase-like domain-containing protein [Suillus clintonianus]
MKPSGSSSSTAVSVAQTILHRQNVHSHEASQHRLNQQRPQNPSSLNASDVKRKVSALKANARAAKIDIDFTIQQYLYGSSKPSKLAIPSSRVTFPTSELATSAFEQLASKARGLYNSTPPLLGLSDVALDLMFDWHTIKFCTVLNNTTVNMIEEQKYLVSATMESLYGNLKQDRMLSEKDANAKTPKITLRLFLYVPETDEDNDIQEVQQNRRVSTRKSTAPSSRQKRKRSPSASPERLRPAKRYQSSYRSRCSATAPTVDAPAPLEFECFKMKRVTCSVNDFGEPKMVYSEEEEEIMVAKGWQAHVKAGKPYQGYLGQGLMKFVFRGRYNNTDYAVLQCKRIRSRDVDNEEDLMGELEILHLSQYFLDSFYKRGDEENVRNLPKMKWNITGAFIGKLTQKLADAPNEGEEDSRSLVFSCFMVLPLLPTGSLCNEIKFSGNAEVGINNDSLGSAVDAYAHHVAVDSMYEMIISDIQGIVTPDRSIVFFDPQSHTANGDSGYWDHGKPAIAEFLESHKCNKFCKALGLDTEVPPLSLSNTNRKGPLRIGFD